MLLLLLAVLGPRGGIRSGASRDGRLRRQLLFLRVLTNPDQLALPPDAALSACWFWHEHGLNALADVGDEASFNAITYRINGGWNGKDDRLQNWAAAKTVLLA